MPVFEMQSYKQFGMVNGKVVRDIELTNKKTPGKQIIKGHLGKRPIRITRRVRFLDDPFRQILTKSKRRKTIRRNRK